MTVQLVMFGKVVCSRPSTQQLFERFWDVTPKRAPHDNPKRPALLKFTRLVEREHIDPEIIISSMIAYAATREGENPKFTAMAVTWLNQHRWESDYTNQSNCGSSYMDFARRLAGSWERK